MAVIVVENFCDEDDSGIISGVFISFSKFFLAPVEETSDEGRNQKQFAISTSDGLDHMENEGHVDLDTLFLEYLSSFDSLPSCSNLDQHSVGINASLLIKSNDSSGSLEGFILMERKACINFG